MREDTGSCSLKVGQAALFAQPAASRDHVPSHDGNCDLRAHRPTLKADVRLYLPVGGPITAHTQLRLHSVSQ